MDPASTVIVIRSLVPGGIAEKDGRLLPGDRLMFVNDVNLESSSLEEAVQALKGAPSGTVKIGVAKPLPVRIWILLIFFSQYLQIQWLLRLFLASHVLRMNHDFWYFLSTQLLRAFENKDLVLNNIF